MATRLNKYLSEMGICSRRDADRYIEAGDITVNGVLAVLGDKVEDSDDILLKGKPIRRENETVYIALNKPIGITSTTNKEDKTNIVDFVNYPSRIFHIGRLDKDSEGLILLTNDGDIVNKILRSENEHEKEYVVQVDKPITNEFVKQMSSGVEILQTITKPAFVKKVNKTTFKIVLTEGFNRQIRRMCRALGYHVVSLRRVRIMNIHLGNLPVGKWRHLTTEELSRLQELTKSSTKTTVAIEESKQ